MSDRIKLAEAMGWVYAPVVQDNLSEHILRRKSFLWEHPDHEMKRHTYNLPDPENDANDDYAVLEWAIKNLDPDAYFEALTEVVGSYAYLHEYRIGCFARAALKVIGTEQ